LSAHRLVAFGAGARLANVHGGCDWWPPSQLLAFFDAAREVEAALQAEHPRGQTSPFPKLWAPFLAHETHRMRALATPHAAQLVLGHYPGTPLTVDLSHWVVGGERTFDFPSDAGWWPALLQQVCVGGGAATAYAAHRGPRFFARVVSARPPL
jgi:hypothetical protein